MPEGNETSSSIPTARELLQAARDHIAAGKPYNDEGLLEIFRHVMPMLSRRRPISRAPDQRHTPPRSQWPEIRHFHASHPDMAMDDIGRAFGTSGARISEIVNFVKPEKPTNLPTPRSDAT